MIINLYIGFILHNITELKRLGNHTKVASRVLLQVPYNELVSFQRLLLDNK